MKIAFLSYNRDPSIPTIDSDGCPVTVRHYATELGKRGHNVTIYANKIIPSKNSTTYLKRKYKFQEKPRVKISQNVFVTRVLARQFTFTRELHLTNEILDIPEISEAISYADYFKRNQLFKYDVVCIFHPLASFGPVFRGLTPLDRTVIFPMLLSDEYKKYQRVSLIYEILEKNSLQNVMRVFSCSNTERKVLVKKGVNQSRVIHRGFDAKIFTHHRKELNVSLNGTVRIICVGSIKPQKQQMHLVEFAKILTQTYTPVITIVGENKFFVKEEYELYYESLLKQIKDYGLERNFRFVGSLAPKNVVKLLKENDFAVFPSASESFGKAALEAICTGIPTILNKEVGAYREFAKNNENAVFYNSTPQACASALQRIMNNSSLYRKLSGGGQKTSSKFSWEKIVDDLERELLTLQS